MTQETTIPEKKIYVAKTIGGLEEILADELASLGGEDIEILNRAVSFSGDEALLYKANYWSRTALRILVPVFDFQLADEDDLYSHIYEFPWEDVLNLNQTLAIDAVVSESELTHSHFVALRTKDAIVDRFRERNNGRRPSVDIDNPDVRVNIHIFGSKCDVSLDSSGTSLHKRGYRVSNAEAPMSEVLAAGLIIMSKWDKKSTFIDPMCGSGTLLIEAGLIANNIPPGQYRKSFGFMQWNSFKPELWKTVVEEALELQTEFEGHIIGNDISAKNLAAAKNNIKSAKLHKDIQLSVGPFSELTPPEGESGVVVINPPYGERIKTNDIIGLYREIGDTLKKNFTGYSATVISSDQYALKSVGLKATQKHIVWNGPLECRVATFDLYMGTRKFTSPYPEREGREEGEDGVVQGDGETMGQGDRGTRGDGETRGQGDRGTRREGDRGPRREGDDRPRESRFNRDDKPGERRPYRDSRTGDDKPRESRFNRDDKPFERKPYEGTRGQGDRGPRREGDDRPRESRFNRDDKPFERKPYEGTRGQGDRGTRRDGDKGTWGQGDRGPRREGDDRPRESRFNRDDKPFERKPYEGTRGQGDRGTRREGDKGTWGQGDRGPRREGDRGTWGQGDKGPRREGDDRPRESRFNRDDKPGERRPYRDSRTGDDKPRESRFNRDDKPGERRPYRDSRTGDDKPRESRFNRDDKPFERKPYEGTRREGDRGTWGQGDRGPRRDGDKGTWGQGDRGPRRDGDKGTWGQGDRGPRRDGDKGTWGQGDRGPRREGDDKPRESRFNKDDKPGERRPYKDSRTGDDRPRENRFNRDDKPGERKSYNDSRPSSDNRPERKPAKEVEIYQPQNRFEKPEKAYRRDDKKPNEGDPSGSKSKPKRPPRPRKSKNDEE